MNNKQSSIQWFFDKLVAHGYITVNQTTYGDKVKPKHEILLEQAKSMYKNEMKNFTEDWYHNGPLLGVGIDVKNTIEQHFNNTYGGGDK